MTAPRRPHIPLTEKLAAALCQMLRYDDDEAGKFVPTIPHDDAKRMTAAQVLSVFQWDHWPIRHGDGGPSVHHNITPRFIAAHRRKSAKIDMPQMAKARRLTAQQEEMRRVLLRPCGEKRKPTGSIAGRGFDKSRTRKFNGRVVQRAGQ